MNTRIIPDHCCWKTKTHQMQRPHQPKTISSCRWSRGPRKSPLRDSSLFLQPQHTWKRRKGQKAGLSITKIVWSAHWLKNQDLKLDRCGLASLVMVLAKLERCKRKRVYHRATKTGVRLCLKRRPHRAMLGNSGIVHRKLKRRMICPRISCLIMKWVKHWAQVWKIRMHQIESHQLAAKICLHQEVKSQFLPREQMYLLKQGSWHGRKLTCHHPKCQSFH